MSTGSPAEVRPSSSAAAAAWRREVSRNLEFSQSQLINCIFVYIKRNKFPSRRQRRLRKELMALIATPTPGLRLDVDSIASNINELVNRIVR